MKKAFVILCLILCSFSLSAADEYSITTQLSVAMPKEQYVQRILPEMTLGERLNVKFDLELHGNFNTLGNLWGKVSSFIAGSSKQIIVVVEVDSQLNPGKSELTKQNLTALPIGSYFEEMLVKTECFAYVMNASQTENASLEFQFNPKSKGQFKVAMNFFLVDTEINYKDLYGAVSQNAVTFLSGSNYVQTITITD